MPLYDLERRKTFLTRTEIEVITGTPYDDLPHRSFLCDELLDLQRNVLYMRNRAATFDASANPDQQPPESPYQRMKFLHQALGYIVDLDYRQGLL